MADISLAPLQPLSIGSGDIEALSSVLTRIAGEHSVLVSTLIRQLFQGRFSWHIGRNAQLHSINGVGHYAITYGERLAFLAGQDSIRRSNLCDWSQILDPRGHYLLHPHRHWCNQCMRTDRERLIPAHDRLYWVVRDVVLCVHHRTTLCSTCPNCGSHQPFLWRLPLIDACHMCGADIVSASSPDGLPISQTDLWKAISVYELLRSSQEGKDPISHTKLLGWLKIICDHHADGSSAKLAAMTGLDGSNLRRWIVGESKPTLSALLHLCQALRCPPASILTGQPHLIDQELALTQPFCRRAPNIRRSDRELRRYETSLRKAMDVNSVPSLKTIARKLGCKKEYLSYRFPELSKKLVALATESRAREVSVRKAARRAGVESAVSKLVAAGIYPSDRNLRSINGIPPSHLRDPDIRPLLLRARTELISAPFCASKR